MDPCILVVDDSSELRRVVARTLTDARYAALEAGDGAVALQILERVEYDGVLTPAPPTSTRAVPRRLVFRRVRGFRIPYALTARWRRTDASPLIAEMLDALRSAHSMASRATEQPLRPGGK